MATEKCEFCGRFGAHKEKYHDPRHVYFTTFYLCNRCRDRQLTWYEELKKEIIAQGKTVPQPRDREGVRMW